MVMDHHQAVCLSAGLCESGSAVGCPGEVEASVNGQDLRRKILASFSKGGSSESKDALDYFNGIL
jgi:hypothetical protein